MSYYLSIPTGDAFLQLGLGHGSSLRFFLRGLFAFLLEIFGLNLQAKSKGFLCQGLSLIHI